MSKSIKRHHPYIETITAPKKFIGVKSWTLSPGRIRDFDIYIFHHDSYGIPRYVLYRGKTIALNASHLKRVESFSKKLYVKRKEYKSYLQYVEGQLHDILGRDAPGLRREEKQEYSAIYF